MNVTLYNEFWQKKETNLTASVYSVSDDPIGAIP